MKYKPKIIGIAAALILIISMSAGAFEMNSTNYAISGVCGSAGGVSDSAGYSVVSAVGEPVVGHSNSASFSLYSGIFVLIRSIENCDCSSCLECTEKLNNSACSIVTLNTNIVSQSGNCINNLSNFNNKIFDCQGHTIDGNAEFNTIGIFLSWKQNNTIRNCIITGFSYGILLNSSSNNTINSNVICNSTQQDIYLTNGFSNSGSNNTCSKSDGWNDTESTGCKNKCGTALKTYSVSLNSGWNLISVPLTPKNTSIKSVLASVEGKYTKVGAWSGGAGKHYIPGFPFNTLNEINEKMGFWIKMNQTGTLTIEGYDPADRKINLQAGWNLVGYLSTNKNQPLTTALSSISGKYTKVGAWINGTGKHYIPGFPFNTLNNMSEGYGYWIKMNSSGVLEYA